MIRALHTAATGMIAQQMNIDNISNNIANSNTTAFKKSRMDFADLMYQTLTYPGTVTCGDAISPCGVEIGLGVRPVSSTMICLQGNFKETGNPLDIGIVGKGYFQIELPNGSIGYTRDGSFHLDNNGNIVDSNGYPLIPKITIPEGATNITIGNNGTVSVKLRGENETQEIGVMEIVDFVNCCGLEALGDNLFITTKASGEPVIIDSTNCHLRQGFLEESNVQLVEEMTSLISAQRAYEANSKSIKSADEMLKTVNQLKR